MSETPRKFRPRRPGRGPRTAMSGGMAGAHGERLKPTPAKAAPSAPPAPEAPQKRRAAGFLHAAALAARPIREVSARRGFAETRVLTDWPAIVGEALSRACTPVRVSYSGKSFGATLIVQAEGARAPEVEMMGPRLVERVNAHYGYRAVSRVKVVQTGRMAPASGLAEAAAAFDRSPPPPDAAPVAAAPEVESVQDPGLRAALERLGRRISARR